MPRRAGDWHGGRGRHCEVREVSWRAAGPIPRRRNPNGGIQATGWDRDKVRLRVRVTPPAAHRVRPGPSPPGAGRTDGGVRCCRDRRAVRPRARSRGSDLRLDVPRDANCNLEANNGGIHIEDFAGGPGSAPGQRRRPPGTGRRPPRGPHRQWRPARDPRRPRMGEAKAWTSRPPTAACTWSPSGCNGWRRIVNGASTATCPSTADGPAGAHRHRPRARRPAPPARQQRPSQFQPG